MPDKLETIFIIEQALLDLMATGHLPSQVEQQIEKACFSIMQARILLKLSLEDTKPVN